ncbi:MAG: hypothetical protein AB7O04_05455 [Hyphomonadaceae bacterium]
MLDLLLITLFQAAAGEPQTDAAATTTPQTESTATVTEEADEDLDRVVCRRVAVVGSRIGERRCTTRRQQIADERAAQQQLREGTMPVGQHMSGQ